MSTDLDPNADTEGQRIRELEDVLAELLLAIDYDPGNDEYSLNETIKNAVPRADRVLRGKDEPEEEQT